MAYTKTNWVNGETALSADNMNKIEQGIYDAHEGLDSASDLLYSSEFVEGTYGEDYGINLCDESHWAKVGGGPAYGLNYDYVTSADGYIAHSSVPSWDYSVNCDIKQGLFDYVPIPEGTSIFVKEGMTVNVSCTVPTHAYIGGNVRFYPLKKFEM